MTLTILAAGLGSRYGGLKQLDPMTANGEFIIDFSIFDALRAGIDRVVFIIKRENEALFRETIGDRVAEHIHVEYAYQDITMIPKEFSVPQGRVKPWGTGHALLCAKETIGDENFIVINADDFYGSETFRILGDFLASQETSGTEYAMAGYILKNTLTENGSVARGLCQVEPDGRLLKIIERTKIYRNENGETVYSENDVEYPTDENGYASMNCWAFTPRIFEELESRFTEFLHYIEDPITSEFYLPSAVNRGMEAGRCCVRVLPTPAQWYGVTYAADKEAVTNSVLAMIEKGKYPHKLWNK
ncbi:MAG: nucleotidyltransferase [Ruminococcaceae bacterium]|nr:nucleotidyltransferase [Oscillospiraceae bacterium]